MGAIHSTVRKNLIEIFSTLKGKKKASMAILGLDASGKSTLVNLFKKVNLPTYPTLGFNFEQITFGDTIIKIWDLGGQKEFVSYWKQYVDGIDGLVFMIDIADERRFRDSLEGFKGIVPYLKEGLPVLMFINKIDLISDKSEVDRRINKIESIFGIENDRSGFELPMKMDDKHFKAKLSKISVKEDLQRMNTDATSTIQHSSVYSGFKWLVESIKKSDNTFKS